MTVSLAEIDAATLTPEAPLLARLVAQAALDEPARGRIAARAAAWVGAIREDARPGLMETFLAEYGLSTAEGVALMCLAEALLRVPDTGTMDALIEDKIAPADWGRHLGRSASSLVNASTWALMLTGRVLEDSEPGIAGTLRAAVRRLGEPVIRAAAGRAMKELGRQFVLGETIAGAKGRAAAAEAEGWTFSYDMLGEAARTAHDAARYTEAYRQAIAAVAGACTQGEVRLNPGISVKLSALHPRYEPLQEDRVRRDLVPVLTDLARQAAAAGMGLTVDAEEAERLVLSLKVIEAVASDPALTGWDGFGVVVQAYGRRAGPVIDWLDALARRRGRRFAVRLVKGAYWDSEVKRAQALGLADFPVFSRKAATDVSYIAHARGLLDRADRLYPQFATHNAHTVAAVLEMAQGRAFEFQRLHGMGEALHARVRAETGGRCRIYAPVGAHRDLLAYLVRRLLENGANSSFVNRVMDAAVPPEVVAGCPFAALEAAASPANPAIRRGPDLFAPARRNARGFDLSAATERAAIEAARRRHAAAAFEAAPMLAVAAEAAAAEPVCDPATGATVGSVRPATARDVDAAFAAAQPWSAPPAARRAVLEAAADALEAAHGEVFALLAREAGKTLPDAVAELREAVDFLRYYAAGIADLTRPPLGTVACIAPWNFPLAIFAGQVAAALAAGNAVLAKPAPQTPLVAALAVRVLHAAGVPRTALQLLPGDGAVGAALTRDPRCGGVVFTGSTATAHAIRRAMAEAGNPVAPLIAETGGINAMIVDSTALPEQAVRDVLASAFQSAGQRCSALRCLYVQEDVAEGITEMLLGAMDELCLGTPWDTATDIGPLIDAAAAQAVQTHVERARTEGRLLKQIAAPGTGHFVGPAVVRVGGIGEIGREVFGPVLHLATFRAEDLDRVVADINSTGYGLTFGLHSRIDARVQAMTAAVRVGNLYVNRNQIGAVVGSQPFGGEGLSGTGPKAGGPHYLPRLTRRAEGGLPEPVPTLSDLPGPTGESNRLSLHPRPPILCLGPGAATEAQAAAVRALGGTAEIHPGPLAPEALSARGPLGGVLWWGDAATARALAVALAGREGSIVPLIAGVPDGADVLLERHLCIDTTAAGGNASLLAAAESA